MTPSPALLQTLLFCLFAALVVFAAVRDAVSYTIPNWVSAALVAIAIPTALILGVPTQAILAAVIVAVVLLGAGMVMFALKWMGGGDAKLMAAAALWIGLPGIASFFLYTGLAGGILALGLIGARSAFLRPFAASGPAWVGRLATPGAAAPYGVAIAMGALAAFPHGLLMRAAHGGF
ncbi:MAG TPA: prepilin peptidase [Caulobacteraceae bacterium]